MVPGAIYWEARRLNSCRNGICNHGVQRLPAPCVHVIAWFVEANNQGF